MRCHYEVLGVAQNASDSELKKAYYKMALQWHPDKNPDRMEEAKTQFQLIQAAYDTLSDPQERAFYDRNRESILRGKASEGNSKPETLDLFKYFSSQCYSGFNDSEKGFYTVYRQVFEKVAALDMQYMNDEEEEIFIPSFGQSDSDLEDVGRFYAYWSSYCSSMDFRWADEYDIREAQRMGRWVEKKIEKDNNKARQKARRQFNEEVRALVAYVRKRDKRWLERKKQINAKIAENAQKQLACQQRQREERQKSMKEHVDKERANLAAYEEQLKLLEGQFAREWGMTDSEYSDYSEEDVQEGAEGPMEDQEIGEEQLVDELYCVACNKTFKTEKAMENHQRSKKHKENLESLKAAMNAEDREYFNSSTLGNEAEERNEESAAPSQKTSKKKKKKKSSQETPHVPQVTESVGRKKKKKQKDIISLGISGFSSEDSDGETIAQPHNNSDDVDVSSKPVPAEHSESSGGLNDDKNRESERVLNGDSGEGKVMSSGEEDKGEEDRLEAKPKLKGKKAKDAKRRAKEASSTAEPEAKSAIKAKLVELGTYVDEELPDYIMVLVANKKTKDQMDDDLSLFLGHNTERFTSWLHHVLQKLNAAALLQGSAASAEAGRNKVVAPQDDIKKKEIEEEKRREKEEEKKKEREEEKKRVKAEETKKLKEEEKRKVKDKDKVDRKRKSSERKNEKKDKKMRKSESPPASEKLAKERKLTSEVVKPVKPKETVKEKEKEKSKPQPSREDAATGEKTAPVGAEAATAESSLDVSLRKIKPLVRGKISSADIFRAECQAEQKKEEEEEELEEDLLELRADVDDLGLELEDEPAPRRSKQEHLQRAIQLKPEGREDSRSEPKVTIKMDGREKADHREKIDHREKVDLREKAKNKPDPPAPRLSAKERLGGIVPLKSSVSREKPSVLDRLGSSAGGKHIINLREESGASARSESSSSGYSQGVARAVSSAITSAQRSVCVLPPSNSSGKKLEARVRPLMSRQVESSHGGVSRGVTEVTSASSEERLREGAGRLSSGRVVSAVGAVLKRPLTQSDSDEEEEYDPKKPGLSGVASKVEVTPRPRRPRAIQANTALILRAMADAHKSVNRPSHHSSSSSREREKPEKQKSRKKHKGELFSRSYREREEASRQKVPSEPHISTQEEVRIRKIAITVPNATHKESEKQVKQEKEKVKEEEEVEVEVSVALREDVPEEAMETSKKEPDEEPLEVDEDKATVSDNDFGMEEVEEVEEEVVDEGIEEDQSPLQHPLPPPVLASRENTKFIVTLEGVDSEVFPEKEESLGIRSRLGARPVPPDTEDQVEEYIEEVEEWEEEEEMSEEVEASSGLPIGGAVTGVKARLKAAATPPVQPGGTKERCKYWPLCKAGEACIYHHPTVTCKSFPACKFGDKCLFIHPNCLYDGACTRIGCPYTHASSRNFAMVSAAAAAQKHSVLAPTRTSNIKCKFFPKCTNLSCPFLHPKACYYGASCKTPNCSFTHPAVPMGAKLKWVAPKASTTQSTTPTTSTVDSKEVGKKEETLVNK